MENLAADLFRRRLAKCQLDIVQSQHPVHRLFTLGLPGDSRGQVAAVEKHEPLLT